ncbi:NAD(P)-dependent oxidoreductase [Rhodococcus erythropolis]|uniref:NAD(P)-dependent oxidoreductase n=1 Tax=Rhodococcus erythropolis TaxID=1833 RepID=UPI001BECAFC4|nr:NAD(P)-binding domain-containing protein [Rhodococcus erythropolis]MBT2266057.1 NAD(P)-dependent oxidoreductase [Rhodococcus erythropolis]
MTRTSQNTTTVTVVGLGAMGTALADAFLDAGHRITVWNRTPAKANMLAARGATVAESVHDAVLASNLIVVCLSDYDAVRAVFESVDDLSQRTVLNVTTGRAVDAREMAVWTASRNGSYLDGAILEMTSGIGADKSGTVFFSGSKASWNKHEGVLCALGRGVQYLGADAGLTGLYDLAALGMTWSVINAFLHASAMFEAEGENPKSMLPLVSATLQNVSGWLDGFADQIATGIFPPDGDIGAQLRGIENLLAESEAAGINTDLPRYLNKLAMQAVEAGDVSEGYPALIKQFRRPSVSE